MDYPEKLSVIIDLFSSFSESQRRETLVAFAEQARLQEPRSNEIFDLEDARKDQECTDTVTIFVRIENNRIFFRILLGPHVQTLTKAMATLLCKGFEGISPEDLLNISSDFIPKIIGKELVRIRSQTVYYLLNRMKNAIKIWKSKQQATNYLPVQ